MTRIMALGEKISSEKFLTQLSFVLLVGAALNQFRISLSWSYDSWQLTEWLINYTGGFVRRGLAGEVIRWLSGISGFQANHIVIFLSYVLYGYLYFFILKRTKGIFPPIVVMSPLLMGSPAFHDFIVRKDVLVLIVFLICLKVLNSARGRGLETILLPLLCVTGVLIHESFFFVGFPPVMMIILNRRNGEENSFFNYYLLLSLVSVSTLAAFAGAVFFKGTPEVTQAINDSWLPLWEKIDGKNCCYEKPAGAIAALGWTTAQGISLSLSVLKSFSMGIYVPLAWMITIFFCYWFIVQFFIPYVNFSRENFSNILILQFVCISPLFVLGWDFGRWMFLWVASSVLLCIFEFKFHYLLVRPSKIVTDALLKSAIFSVKPRFWLLLIFGIPGCCWTVKSYLISTSLGYYFALLLRMLRGIF